MQCDAAELVCAHLSCVRHVGFLIQGCTQVLELSEGGSNGNRAKCTCRRSSDESKRRELVVAHTCRILVHNSFSFITESSILFMGFAISKLS